MQDVALAARLGVTGTPMFFVNGRLLRGSQPLVAFVDAVEAALGAAGVGAGAPPGAGAEAGVESARPTDPKLREIDLTIAALLACRQGSAEQARGLYAELAEGSARRRLVREDCARLGVELPK
jgi:hypothetical protein